MKFSNPLFPNSDEANSVEVAMLMDDEEATYEQVEEITEAFLAPAPQTPPTIMWKPVGYKDFYRHWTSHMKSLRKKLGDGQISKAEFRAEKNEVKKIIRHFNIVGAKTGIYQIPERSLDENG